MRRSPSRAGTERATSSVSFAAALGFVTSVGALAEGACHHPEIELSYDLVRLRLSTHEIGGLSTRDLELAAQVELLP